MAGAALGREAEHGYVRIYAGKRLGGLVGRHGYLCQLLGIGVGNHGAVGKHHHAVSPVRRTFGKQHKERAGNNADAFLGLDNLESGTKHVACGAQRTRDLTVGIAVLDEQTAQIERVVHLFVRALKRHALGFAQLIVELRIFLSKRLVGRVDDCGMLNVF